MKSFGLKFAAVLGALTLWFFVVSDKSYNIDVEIPLKMTHLNSNLAVASYIPQNLNVSLEGKGLDLIKILSSKSAAWIELDMLTASMGLNYFNLEPSLFKCENSESIKLLSINYAPLLQIELDAKIQRKIPIQLKKDPVIKEGYTLLQSPKLSPDSVILQGARKVLMRISHISTINLPNTPLNKSDTFKLALELGHISHKVSSSIAETQLILHVEPLISKSFAKIPVSLIGSHKPKSHQLNPKYIAVTISGAQSIISNTQADQIRAFIEYSRFQIEKQASIKPTLNYPLGVESYEIQPRFIQLTVKESTPPSISPDSL